jgi:hypothetical protein
MDYKLVLSEEEMWVKAALALQFPPRFPLLLPASEKHTKKRKEKERQQSSLVQP